MPKLLSVPAVTILTALLLTQSDLVYPLTPGLNYNPIEAFALPGMPLPPGSGCYYEEWVHDTLMDCQVYQPSIHDLIYFTYSTQDKIIQDSSVIVFGTPWAANAGHMIEVWGQPSRTAQFGYSAYLWWDSERYSRFAFTVLKVGEKFSPFTTVGIVGYESHRHVDSKVWRGWTQ